MRLLAAVCLAVLLCACTAHAREASSLSIPMRDGALLAADLYRPAGAGPLPVVLVQTPYGKGMFAARLAAGGGESPLFASEDLAFVIVDWRGRHANAAITGRPVGTDGADGYDAVEWIAAQPWCNGRVGTWGLSALGVAQYRTAETQPPHLVCCVPMVCAAHYRYESFYPGGGFRLEYADTLDALGFGMKRLLAQHPTHDLAWRLMDRRWSAARITVPMLLIGGWYDIHTVEVLEDFADLRANSDPTVRDQHRCLMGPWSHSAIDQLEQGELQYPGAVQEASREALAFLRHYLGDGPAPEGPPLRYCQMGADEWRECAAWPPGGESGQTLNLHADGGLLPEPAGVGEGAVAYTYDPADPTPTLGGSNLSPVKVRAGPLDQRPVEARADVRTWTTAPLTAPLTVAGRPVARLTVASDCPGTDFAVRLCDVYPDGRSMLVCDGIARVVFAAPGEPQVVEVRLPDTALTVRPGHAVRVSVSSANTPRFDVNLNRGTGPVGEGPGAIARNQVWTEAGRESTLLLPGAVD